MTERWRGSYYARKFKLIPARAPGVCKACAACIESGWMEPALHYRCDAAVTPARCIATQLALLDEIAAGARPPTLYVYSLDADLAALGRFHVAPETCGDGLTRRLGGGRVVPAGPGYVGVALLMPRRDALLAREAPGLSAAQVMNRLVRGLLSGLRTAGLDPIYPGRDIVTIGKREVAVLSLETDHRGAAVFELVVATERRFDELPGRLERADPGGVVLAPLPTPDSVVSLAEAAGRPLGFDEVAALLLRGYSDVLGCRFEPCELDDPEIDRRGDTDAPDFVGERRLARNLRYKGTAWGQLGAVEVYFAGSDDRFGRILISGDYIANSPAVFALEERLAELRRGSPRVGAEIRGAFAGADDYLLGLGDGSPLVEAIERAVIV